MFLPVRLDRPAEAVLLIVDKITEETLRDARLSLNGVEVRTRIEPGPDAACRWVGCIDPEDLAPDDREELRLRAHPHSTSSSERHRYHVAQER